MLTTTIKAISSKQMSHTIDIHLRVVPSQKGIPQTNTIIIRSEK